MRPGFAVLFVCAGVLLGQSLTSLNGTVMDPSGAVIPEAVITLVNVDRQAARETVSDAAGRYVLAQVLPGNYQIKARAKGFADVVVSEVRLLVNSPATVNIQFEKVGAVAEAISVSAEAVQVNTTDASLGNAFSTTAIMQLPFEARNVVGLLALQPGVTFLGEAGDSRNGAVNGGKSDQANVTLDGVDVNDQQDRSAFTSVLRVTLDSVQEFRVTTTNANAEQGRSSGAQVALVTKSGTNTLHGSAYEYHRNTVTAANSFFNNAARPGVPRQKLIRNVFGASAGGPIQPNRLFYFFNFEGRRDARDGAVNRTVPSELFRQGILQYQRRDGSVARLEPAEIKSRIDPLGIGVNPEALKLFQSFPQPNNSSVGDGLNTAGFRFIAPIRLRQNTYIARLDYSLDAAGKHALFLRANLQNDHDNGMPQFPGEPPNSVNLNNSKGLAAGHNAVLRPNLIGTFRYGYTRQGTESTGVQSRSAVGFMILSDRYGLSTGLTQIIPVHNTTQDFTWTKGAHNLQFGAAERWVRNSRSSFSNSFHYAEVRASWLQNSGHNLQSLVPELASGFRNAWDNAIVTLLGLVSQFNARYNYDLSGNVLPVGAPVRRKFRGNEYELYVQDSWRVSRALTVTAGLRYSLMPPIREANGIQIAASPAVGEWFDRRGGAANQGRPQYDAGLIRYVVASSPEGRPLYPYHKKNFAPRLALAYSPQAGEGLGKWLFGGAGKTSIRAGWGMYYDLFGQSLMRSFDANSFGLSASIPNPGNVLTETTAPRFAGVFELPAQLTPQPAPVKFPTYPPEFTRTRTVDGLIRPPYTLNMDFSVGREFGGGFFVQAAYVGRLSRRSLVQSDVAAPTNLKDAASGMTYFEAAQQLARLSRVRTPVAQVPKIPFWENLWPAAAGGGLTATQAVYNKFLSVEPSYVDGMEDLDRNCRPACSVFGKHALFSSQFPSAPAWRSIGGGNYHALQWTARKRFTQGVQFDLNYTWSKSIDLASRAERDGLMGPRVLSHIINPWNPKLNKGVSDYDTQHQWNANWVAELPFGKGRKWLSGAGGPVNAILGGWQVTGLWRQTSGFPISVGNGRNWPTNWEWQGMATQVGVVPAPQTTKNAPAVVGAGGPNVFTDPRAAVKGYDFTYPGEVGQRNGIRGDGYFTVDLGLGKRFLMPFNEKHSLQFRWETFNLSNSVRFDVRSLSIDLGNTGTFGKYSDLLTLPRVMQFGLRYEF